MFVICQRPLTTYLCSNLIFNLSIFKNFAHYVFSFALDDGGENTKKPKKSRSNKHPEFKAEARGSTYVLSDNMV